MVVQILQGSALDVLRTLPSESVQCVVTSPPYFQLRDYQVEGQIGLEPTPAAFIASLVAVFDEVKRVLRPDGVCFVNLGDSYAGSGKGPSGHNGIGDQERRQGGTGTSLNRARSSYKAGVSSGDGWQGVEEGYKRKDLLLIPERFAIAMQDAGWYVRSRIAWCKTSAMPESVRDRPTSAWEHLWMFTKSARYFWDADAVRQGYARLWDGEASNGKTLAPGSVHTLNTGQPTGHVRQAKPIKPDVGANLRNYWLLGPEPSRLEHYAGFPTELPRRCIKAASRPGDTVLDPFLGSGTTALVADQLGRHAIGIELNEQYVEMARRRIESDAPMVQEPVSVETPTQVGLFEEIAG